MLIRLDCIQFSVGKSFDITYIRIVFYSPRPESFAIYKRQIINGPWIPYQYYRYVFFIYFCFNCVRGIERKKQQKKNNKIQSSLIRFALPEHSR